MEKTWPGYKDYFFIKKVKVQGITLNEYCKKNKIFKINYLHIDTQGNDLKSFARVKKSHIVERA